MQEQWFGWWAEADWVVRGVFVALIAMSLIGWTTIFFKAWQLGRFVRHEVALARVLEGAESPPSLDGHRGPSLAFGPLLRTARPREVPDSLLAQVVRELRTEVESGLVLLATIGNTAPFVGLLGTVWGIMHALQGLSGETALTLAMVGGPVAEALVATAAGLFAAIPAVIGYNMLLRRLTRLMVVVEGNGRRLLDAAAHRRSQHEAQVAVLRATESH